LLRGCRCSLPADPHTDVCIIQSVLYRVYREYLNLYSDVWTTVIIRVWYAHDGTIIIYYSYLILIYIVLTLILSYILTKTILFLVPFRVFHLKSRSGYAVYDRTCNSYPSNILNIAHSAPVFHTQVPFYKKVNSQTVLVLYNKFFLTSYRLRAVSKDGWLKICWCFFKFYVLSKF